MRLRRSEASTIWSTIYANQSRSDDVYLPDQAVQCKVGPEHRLRPNSILPGKSFSLVLPPSPPHGPAVPPSIDTWISKYWTDLSAKAQAPGTWAGTYFSGINSLADNVIQVAGLLDGWRFGDKLFDGSISGGPACIAALRQLVNSRHTSMHVGYMVGYTLFYLCGYLNNERTAQLVGGNPLDPPLTAAADIFNKYSTHSLQLVHRGGSPASGMFAVANQFYDVVLADYYLLTQKPSPNVAVLANYYAFLQGFQQGQGSAATAMFAVMYNAGWGNGYDAGFAAGYQVGYTAGFDTGYGEGYSTGWKAGNYANGGGSFTSTLNGVFTNLGQSVSDVNTIVTDITSVASAGTALASLF